MASHLKDSKYSFFKYYSFFITGYILEVVRNYFRIFIKFLGRATAFEGGVKITAGDELIITGSDIIERPSQGPQINAF